MGTTTSQKIALTRAMGGRACLDLVALAKVLTQLRRDLRAVEDTPVATLDDAREVTRASNAIVLLDSLTGVLFD